MWRKVIFALLTQAILIPVVVTLTPFSGLHDVAHETTRIHLNLFGSSIYEYHSTTGKWPIQIEDLAKTSLPQRSPYWKQMLDSEVNVIVWHKTLKSDPKDNAGHVLVYHNNGLIARRGRSWVCWGDLRTEYIKTKELRNYLQNLKN